MWGHRAASQGSRRQTGGKCVLPTPQSILIAMRALAYLHGGRKQGLEWSVHGGAVWGGSSEAIQSLVLRQCIPAGWLPVSDAFLTQSHQGDYCLEFGPTFSKFKV